MPTPIQYPYVGGYRHSPSSSELKVTLPNNSAFILSAWQKIDYKWELSAEPVYGNHPDPVGFTIGQAKYEAELELLLAEYNYFLGQIISAMGGGGGFATLPLLFTVTHTENGFDTIADQIIGCRIAGGDTSIQAGGAQPPQKRTLPLKPLKIKPNGIDMLAVALQGPPQ